MNLDVLLTFMITSLTKQDLINFEEDIAECFNRKEIRAPIHLGFGYEDAIIKVFQNIKEDDWVFGTWRSHFMCLLKGVPPAELKQAILDGKSISLCFPQYRIFSSAIVTGNLPIALGTALAIKRDGGTNKVYAFVGDMTAETGMMSDCLRYAIFKDLPIHFVIEDNGKSVCTDTKKTWGLNKSTFEHFVDSNGKITGPLEKYISYFKYDNKYPHAGSGTRIQF